MRWRDGPGTAIVVRADHGPLSPLDVEALCHFCRCRLRPLFENSLGPVVRDMPEEEVLAENPPQKYCQYCGTYLTTRGGDQP